jgi:ubiquinone/menaquinone biosynthesis C-methylase UbiE
MKSNSSVKNLDYVYDIAKKEIPKVKLNWKKNMLRHHIANQLKGDKNIGIELGVAKGIFSKKMVQSRKFSFFYGVDSYSDKHNTAQYCEALKYIGFNNYKYNLLRMNFDEALNMFDDNYFDFIYIDGYAHTGEEGGKTIVDWFKKLKVGGIISGDDYDKKDWPLVNWAVNDFASKVNSSINITLKRSKEDYSGYPNWYLIKKKNIEPQVNQKLFKIAMSEKIRIHKIRDKKYRGNITIRYIVRILDLLGIKNFLKKIIYLISKNKN